MANETILVIDKEESCIFLDQRVLSPAGYRVITASSSQNGLEYAQCEQPDLILTELKIGTDSGLRLLACVREAGCQAPAILMTSADSGNFGIEVFRLGIRSSLIKPFTMSQILQAIDQVLQETRLTHESERLNHNIEIAEAVRMTVITLSHYLNNNLMATSGVLTLLEEALHDNSSPEDMLEMLQNGKESLQGIRAVLKVLRQTTEIEVSSYSVSTPMVDIQALLEKELEKVHRNTRALGNRLD